MNSIQVVPGKTIMDENRLFDQVRKAGQQHLLQFWNELNDEEKQQLKSQIESLDWNLIDSYQPESGNDRKDWDQQVRRATPPSHVVRFSSLGNRYQQLTPTRELGETALRQGKVGAVLLAGGQGTRLGFEHSKGLFPIGPVTGKTLLELLATQVLAVSRRYGVSIPYFVMTSDGTHHEIEEFYKKNSYFGLNPDDVYLFEQGRAPSLDMKTGQVLLASKSSLSLNPDGHGGIFAALWKAGLFETMRARGIEYLFSHQIDNPLVKVCDPEFIGLHLQHQADVSTKVVSKTGPDEKVGVAADINGRTQIIEYIDMPEELAKAREANGELRFWAGSTAIHLFNRSFVERVATSQSELPWHRAIKRIPYINEKGDRVVPETENGVKFERFIFDTLPLAKVALIVETLRDEEFAPLKNKSGDFSPDYVRERMVRVATNWLRDAGIRVPKGIPVEISPLFAMNSQEIAGRLSEIAGLEFDRPQFLGPNDPIKSDF
jgi:UDP-N-acetylglucosamine/UDP-N-acetylgalactosamine diphosphorylase